MKSKRLLASVFAPAILGALFAAPPAVASSHQVLLEQQEPPSIESVSTSADWVAIPGGYAYADCVHEVPNGSYVSETGNVYVDGILIKEIPPCTYSGIVSLRDVIESSEIGSSETSQNASVIPIAPLALQDGWWVASTWDQSTYQITKLSAQWTVPPNPASTHSGLTIFFFPSVQTGSATGGIVQPVLQWGTSKAGGTANAWSFASWYVAGGNAVFTTPIATSAGHVIQGSMSRSGASEAKWSISTKNVTNGTSATLSANTTSTTWKHVQGGALEVYGANACTNLPNTTSVLFSSISVSQASGTLTPAFSAYKPVSSCSTGVTFTTNSTTLKWSPK